MYELTRRDETAPPREFDDLDAAMAAAGHADYADWQIATGLPDQINTDWKPEYRYWVIRGPGVAHELIDMLPDKTRSAGTWSTWDSKIAMTVMAILPSAEGCAFDAGMLIAAHYAAAGQIDCARIGAAINWAYNQDKLRLPASKVGSAVFAVAEALTVRKFFITDYDPQPPPWLIGGVAGSGKSTLLTPMGSPDLRAMLEDPGTRVQVFDGKDPASPFRPSPRRWLAALAICRPAWQINIPAGRAPRWLCWVATQLIDLVQSFGLLAGGLWLTWRLAGGPLGLRTQPGCYIFHAYQPAVGLTPCPLWPDFWSWHQWAAAWSTARADGAGLAFDAWLVTWLAVMLVAERLVGFWVVPRRDT